MRIAAFVLWLAAAATAAAEPAPRTDRIHEVRFTGDLAFAPEVLGDVLESLDVRRVIPGIWTRQPPYDARAIEADLVRLRSFYRSRGYFEAQVGVAHVAFSGGGATVTLHVRAGPGSRVRQVRIEGLFGDDAPIVADPDGGFPVAPLCASLLDARQAAEAAGRLDFDAAVEVVPVDGETNVVDVMARVRMGSAHAVGRIDFSGHYGVNDSTLRRALALQEGDLFDVGKLRRGLARLTASGLFEPLDLHDIRIAANADGVSADVTIPLRERPRRRWSLAGPLDPPGLASLRASISTRLPPWGRGLFEASTYYLTLNLSGFATPILSALSLTPKARPAVWLALERPYLPGQAPFSGFVLSPTRSTQSMLDHYGRTHAARGLRAVLGHEARDGMSVPVTTNASRQTGGGAALAEEVIICSPPRPKLSWLRRGALLAADLGLAWLRVP